MSFRKKQLYFPCLTMLAATFLLSAAQPPESSEVKIKPAQVLVPGSRIVAGDPEKNEFYILREDQPDPLIGKKGTYVNTEAMQSGIEMEHVLNANPDEALSEVNTLWNARIEEAVNKPAEEVEVKNPQPVAPVVIPKKVDQKDDANASNYGKVKAFLHKLTQKMADKKKHSKMKTRVARKTKPHYKYVVTKKDGMKVIRVKYVG